MIPANVSSLFLRAAAEPPPSGVYWNPAASLNMSFSNSNKTITDTVTGAGARAGCYANTNANGGKYYFECIANFTASNDWYIGFLLGGLDLSLTGLQSGEYTYRASGQTFTNGSQNSGFPAITTGDVVGVAANFTNGYVWFRINGTWVNSGDPVGNAVPVLILPTGQSWYPAARSGSGASINSWVANFSGPFANSAPSGFLAWG